MIIREPISVADDTTAASIKSALKQLNATESSSYSIFAVNSLYLVSTRRQYDEL